jgi:hypothetical protein
MGTFHHSNEKRTRPFPQHLPILNTLISLSLSRSLAILAALALWRGLAFRSTGLGMIFRPGLSRSSAILAAWALWRGPTFRSTGLGMIFTLGLWRDPTFRLIGPGRNDGRGLKYHECGRGLQILSLGDFGYLGSVTGPSVQADQAWDDFHARLVTGPDVQTNWPGKEWRSRSQISRMRSRSPNSIEVPRWKVLGHTPVWGRLSTKGNRPEKVITPVPWAHYRNSIK